MVDGAKSRVVAAPGLTVRLAVAENVPAVSDAVSVWLPAFTSVAVKLPLPPVSVVSGGRTTPADVSLLLKCTVPA